MYDIYLNSPDNQCRFALGKEGPQKLFVIALNPSTADKENSDVTMAKVETVSFANGYSGFVMFNLYPLRSTAVGNLPEIPNNEQSNQNIRIIEDFVSQEESPPIWAAWGNPIRRRPYFITVLREIHNRISRLSPRWLHYGDLTANGNPRHPSRLSYSWKFQTFDIDRYLR